MKATPKIEKLIRKYCKSHDIEYVKNNILYSNSFVKKKASYHIYLEKALKENYAEEWSNKKIIDQEKKEKEEVKSYHDEQEVQDKLEKIELVREAFLKQVRLLKNNEKDEAKKLLAAKHTSSNPFTERILKVEYIEWLIEYFKKNGEDFSDILSISNNFKFHNQVMNA